MSGDDHDVKMGCTDLFLLPYPNSFPQFYNSLDRNELWDYRFGLGAVRVTTIPWPQPLLFF